MALRLADIRTGSLAYLDHALLLQEPDVHKGSTTIDRPGPFLCLQVKDSQSTWIPLTSEWRAERLAIDPKWRKEGSQLWKTQDQYVIDGLNTFIGPNEAFVRAGAGENPFKMYRRPYIVQAGVDAAIAEVVAQGGKLL